MVRIYIVCAGIQEILYPAQIPFASKNAYIAQHITHAQHVKIKILSQPSHMVVNVKPDTSTHQLWEVPLQIACLAYLNVHPVIVHQLALAVLTQNQILVQITFVNASPDFTKAMISA